MAMGSSAFQRLFIRVGDIDVLHSNRRVLQHHANVLAVAAAEIEYSGVLAELELGAKPLGAPRAKAPRKRKHGAANRVSCENRRIGSGRGCSRMAHRRHYAGCARLRPLWL